MFTVNGNPIMEDELAILEELRRQLELKEISRFNIFKTTGDNIMTNCPFHKGGQERKPSFGISTTTMICHCFACGWSGLVDEMISNLFGYDDLGAVGRDWLAKNFLTLSVEERRPLNINLSRTPEKKEIVLVEGFTEEELDTYRWVHPYMYERKLNDEIIEMFDVGFDENYQLKDKNDKVIGTLQCLTFPVYDVNGRPAFIARRSVTTKFFHYPQGAEKPVYGAHLFTSGKYKSCVICESILNALTCWKHGIPAVALIGTGTLLQYEILKQLPVRKYILALDPDAAGRAAQLKLRQALKGSKVLTEYRVPEGYDLNDLDEKVLDLQEIF